MNKKIIISFLIILIFSIFIFDSSATEINTNTETQETEAQDFVDDSAPEATYIPQTYSGSNSSYVTSVTPVSSQYEANLGLNNILSILLISIGILLILFSIAILIRIKK